MTIQRRKTESAVETEASSQTYHEWLGTITHLAANEMLTNLFNINPFVNSIHEAKDMAYDVDLLHAADEKFVGLILTPVNAGYWTDTKIRRMPDELVETRKAKSTKPGSAELKRVRVAERRVLKP
jgi:hypothetical protein